MEIRITIDDRIVRAFRRARRPLAWTLGTLAFGAGALAVAAPLSKPFDFEAGDPIRASDINDNFDELFDAWDDHIIREDVTIELTSGEDGCAGLAEALADLSEQVIRDEATVTIELGPGVYNCEGPVRLTHPQGGHIQIVGTGASADDVTLAFPTNSVGFTNDLGHSVGLVAHMTLMGDTGGAGINARGPRFVIDDLVVQDFEVGIQAQQGGVLIASNLFLTDNTYAARATAGGHLTLTQSIADSNNNGVVIEAGANGDLTDVAVSGVGGAHFTVNAASARGSLLSAEGGTIGFSVTTGGTLLGQDLTATSCANGFGVAFGGTLKAATAVATDTQNFAFYAHDFGYMNLTQPTATDGGFGFAVDAGGILHVSQPTLSGNNQDYFPPAAAVDLSTATIGIYE